MSDCTTAMHEEGTGESPGSEYREYYDAYWTPQGYNPEGTIFPELRNLLKAYVPSNARCLDVGCGDGGTCGLFIKQHAAEYVGVDISATAVRKACAAGLDARLIGDASKLPFADKSFDIALCVEVLEHLFLPNTVAAEVFRLLKPGGRFISTVPNTVYWRRRLEVAAGRWNPMGDGLSTREPWRDPHIRFFTSGTLGKMLRSTGFDVVEVGGHWGSLLRDFPYLARLFRSPRHSSGLYRVLQRQFPSLLGLRLHAIARRPLDHEK